MKRGSKQHQVKYLAEERKSDPRGIFHQNALEIERLRSRVNELAKTRDLDPEAKAAWKHAAKEFNSSYDKLAFPGGLHREVQRLKEADVEAIEMAVRYLEANPWYFGSGYHKADFLKILGNVALSDDQSARLRAVILDRVRGRDVREMRSYARLARKVTDSDFEEELSRIAQNSNRQAARHAQWVLDYLSSSAERS